MLKVSLHLNSHKPQVSGLRMVKMHKRVVIHKAIIALLSHIRRCYVHKASTRTHHKEVIASNAQQVSTVTVASQPTAR